MSQPVSLGLQREGQPIGPITRACDMCRQKKIRCDVVAESCAQCIKYNTTCHFTPISTKRAPRRTTRDKRVEDLEKRLKSMEGLLKLALANQQPGQSSTELVNNSEAQKEPWFSHPSKARTPGHHTFSSNLDPVSTTPVESSQALDFALPRPEASIAAVAGSPREIPPRAFNFDNSVSKGRTIEALPSKDRLLYLVEKSFRGFHGGYPLFDKARFMTLLESLDKSIKDPARWACLNVVLALAPQFQYGTVQDMKEDSEFLGYFQNAFAVVGQLMTMHVTLWSIQALLGMALVMQGTPNQGPVALLISAAMKLAHRMGLHRQCQDPNVGTAEIEERKRVFWIAYSLDKDFSLQMGQPSAQDDDDMDVEFPSETGDLHFPGKTKKIDSFSCRARLAMIQGQIYKRLYSVKARKQAVTEKIVAVRELEAMLQSWRAGVPLETMKDYQGPFFQVPTSGTVRHPIILQLLYFNSLAIVHSSLPAMPRYRELREASDSIEIQLSSAPLDQSSEARRAIVLLQVTPRRRFACIWAVLHIFVAAATTMLENIICDPSNAMAQSDLKLIEPLLTLLGVLASSSTGRKSERISGMHLSCIELFERANMAVESASLSDIDWDQCVPSEPSSGEKSMDDLFFKTGSTSSEYEMELGSVPPNVSRDFAFVVEQQIRELPPHSGTCSAE